MVKKKRQDWTIIEQLGPIILKYVEGCIVEIGLGKSTHVFLKLATEFNRDHYCFDAKERKCVWAEKRGCKVFFGDTRKTLTQFPDIPVAMGLIDGDHRSEIAIREVNCFLKKLTLGGVVFLHDTSPPTHFVRENGIGKGKIGCGDIYKVRQELEYRASLENFQVFTWPYTAADCGLTMVMKKDPDRPYCQK